VVSLPLLLAVAPFLDAGQVWAPTPIVVAALLYQGVGVAFASYLAWYALVARYPASRLAAFSVLAPLWGVAAGALLLGEAVGPGFLAAIALVAVGLWLVNRPASQPTPSTSTPEATAALASARSSVASGNRRRSASSR
jgi:drug/metabolite transporter (DMT)-like permease